MPEEREAIFRFYLKNMRRCNNWDLVDLTCRDIVGEYLVDKDRSLLYRLAESENLWEQRISIVSTWAFIRRNDFGDTLELSERLIGHKHDLMHKAVGWMLREVRAKRSGRRLPISWNATLLVFLVRRFVMLSSIIRNPSGNIF